MNDVDAFIRIEAIEVMTDILEKVPRSVIEQEFIPQVIGLMDNAIEEVQ